MLMLSKSYDASTMPQINVSVHVALALQPSSSATTLTATTPTNYFTAPSGRRKGSAATNHQGCAPSYSPIAASSSTTDNKRDIAAEESNSLRSAPSAVTDTAKNRPHNDVDALSRLVSDLRASSHVQGVVPPSPRLRRAQVTLCRRISVMALSRWK